MSSPAEVKIEKYSISKTKQMQLKRRLSLMISANIVESNMLGFGGFEDHVWVCFELLDVESLPLYNFVLTQHHYHHHHNFSESIPYLWIDVKYFSVSFVLEEQTRGIFRNDLKMKSKQRRKLKMVQRASARPSILLHINQSTSIIC